MWHIWRGVTASFPSDDLGLWWGALSGTQVCSGVPHCDQSRVELEQLRHVPSLPHPPSPLSGNSPFTPPDGGWIRVLMNVIPRDPLEAANSSVPWHPNPPSACLSAACYPPAPHPQAGRDTIPHWMEYKWQEGWTYSQNWTSICAFSCLGVTYWKTLRNRKQTAGRGRMFHFKVAAWWIIIELKLVQRFSCFRELFQ